MPRFFEQNITKEQKIISLSAENAHHASRVLRLAVNDEITVCDGEGTDFICSISHIASGEVEAQVLDVHPSETEPTIKAHLFQGIAKGDKMDTIIQKAVELGATEITPFFSSRCIVKLDEKDKAKKRERWQKIALEAAMQSQRGIIPKINLPIFFSDAIKELTKCDFSVILYECEEKLRLTSEVLAEARSVGFMVGPEGGFDAGEVRMAQEKGAYSVTLGKRILRTETAPLCALSVIMHITGNI